MSWSKELFILLSPAGKNIQLFKPIYFRNNRNFYLYIFKANPST